MEMLKSFALISSTHAADEYAKVFLSKRNYYIPLLMKYSCPNIRLSDDWSFTLLVYAIFLSSRVFEMHCRTL